MLGFIGSHRVFVRRMRDRMLIRRLGSERGFLIATML
jgi:hypothetical protein